MQYFFVHSNNYCKFATALLNINDDKQDADDLTILTAEFASQGLTTAAQLTCWPN